MKGMELLILMIAVYALQMLVGARMAIVRDKASFTGTEANKGW